MRHIPNLGMLESPFYQRFLSARASSCGCGGSLGESLAKPLPSGGAKDRGTPESTMEVQSWQNREIPFPRDSLKPSELAYGRPQRRPPQAGTRGRGAPNSPAPSVPASAWAGWRSFPLPASPKPCRQWRSWQEGVAEASLKTARARLNAVLAPLKSALGVDGRGTLEAVVQDGVGCLLSMPLLQLEHELDRAHEVLAVLGARLPAIGRALDERSPLPVLGAD